PTATATDTPLASTPTPSLTPTLTPTPPLTPTPTLSPTLTLTPSPTPTNASVPLDIGGKGFTLRNGQGGSVTLSWSDGGNQASNVLVRTQVGLRATRRFPLPASASSFSDTPPL